MLYILVKITAGKVNINFTGDKNFTFRTSILLLLLDQVTRENEEHNAPGAETLVGAEKFQQCGKYFYQCSTFTTKRPYVQTWGCQTCFLPQAPSNLGTPLYQTTCYS